MNEFETLRNLLERLKFSMKRTIISFEVKDSNEYYFMLTNNRKIKILIDVIQNGHIHEFHWAVMYYYQTGWKEMHFRLTDDQNWSLMPILQECNWCQIRNITHDGLEEYHKKIKKDINFIYSVIDPNELLKNWDDIKE